VGFITEEGDRGRVLSQRLSERPRDLGGGVGEPVEDAHEAGG
jgi:hypothetical protein